ncbi:hypothetical protein Moror_12786, partial [Moniliophthora roreri MCA 2997]
AYWFSRNGHYRTTKLAGMKGISSTGIGAIIGFVLAMIALLLVAVLVFLTFMRHRRQRNLEERSTIVEAYPRPMISSQDPVYTKEWSA